MRQRAQRRPAQGRVNHLSLLLLPPLLPVQALQHVMQGTGPAFQPYLDDSLLELLYKCVVHPNRFVRQASMLTVGRAAALRCGCCCAVQQRYHGARC